MTGRRLAVVLEAGDAEPEAEETDVEPQSEEDWIESLKQTFDATEVEDET